MVPENFKENGFMISLGLIIVAFVIAQSLFFLIKAWKQGKKLGISTEQMKNTVVSSAVFTIAPAISILATVIVLANSLGIVLPWIRLSVIGNLAYESVAAEAALDTFGLTLSSPVTDPKVFATVAFVMTIGCILPLILVIFVMKKVQKTMGKVADKNSKLADTLSAAAFIGIIAAFIARSVAGAGTAGDNALYGAEFGDGAGFMSVCVLISAMIFMSLLTFLCKKFKIKWLETFALPISMFAAMGVAILIAKVCPEGLAYLEWRG
ncbi:MAG: DUF5058 family protein [Acutalibacteraceae bacterium]